MCHQGGAQGSRPSRYGEFFVLYSDFLDGGTDISASDFHSLLSSEHTGLFPLVLNFQQSNDATYALAHVNHPDMNAFTVCLHVLLEYQEIHTVLSYTSSGHENEITISISADRNSREVGLWIGNEFVNLPHSFKAHDWTNYCVTWSSQTGGAELWINGMVGEQRYLKSGYSVSLSGVFILGRDQDGLLGISNSNAFVGKMTDVNVWDYILSMADIRGQMSCDGNSSVVGNVLSWGSTRLSFYGGVELDGQYRCS